MSSRNLRIVATVLLMHGAALWALQTGLLRRTLDLLVPAQVLEISPPAETPPPPTPVVRPQVTQPVHAPTPLAVTKAAPQPSPDAPAPVVAAAESNAPERPVTTAAVSHTAVVAPPVPPAPPKLELPSSDADYLNNPKPPYPPLSKRMGEQGKVVIRTLIGVDGVAQDATIHQSSGFDRLDQAALATARKWRYVPGKRAGVPEAMWFIVPFSFVLE
ncbi:MAG: energy transducer TonB [Burkholderiales bacterium]|nr:energy transducer TonB [Burkholderiales bacterium]